MVNRAFNIFKHHFDTPNDPEELWEIDYSEDDDYLKILTGCYIKGLSTLMSSYRIKKGNIIFATDCKKRNIWRLDVYSDYKLKRIIKQQNKTGLNKRPLFKYITDTLLPIVTDKHNLGFLLSHDYAEGDDIIAVSHGYLRTTYSDSDVIILTNDSDMLQLHDDKTLLRNMENLDLMTRSIGSPKHDLMYKILLGDVSDDIPSCFEKTKGDKLLSRGFGKKTAMKVMKDLDLLKEKFKQYPEAVKRYKRNKQLIDLTFIPKDIKEEILQDIAEFV